MPYLKNYPIYQVFIHLKEVIQKGYIIIAGGDKNGAFKRNQIYVEYYNKIMAQNGKYQGHYAAKVEVMGGSPNLF